MRAWCAHHILNTLKNFKFAKQIWNFSKIYQLLKQDKPEYFLKEADLKNIKVYLVLEADINKRNFKFRLYIQDKIVVSRIISMKSWCITFGNHVSRCGSNPSFNCCDEVEQLLKRDEIVSRCDIKLYHAVETWRSHRILLLNHIDEDVLWRRSSHQLLKQWYHIVKLWYDLVSCCCDDEDELLCYAMKLLWCNTSRRWIVMYHTTWSVVLYSSSFELNRCYAIESKWNRCYHIASHCWDVLVICCGSSCDVLLNSNTSHREWCYVLLLCWSYHAAMQWNTTISLCITFAKQSYAKHKDVMCYHITSLCWCYASEMCCATVVCWCEALLNEVCYAMRWRSVVLVSCNVMLLKCDASRCSTSDMC